MKIARCFNAGNAIPIDFESRKGRLNEGRARAITSAVPSGLIFHLPEPRRSNAGLFSFVSLRDKAWGTPPKKARVWPHFQAHFRH